jgi:plastocyanin
MSVLSQPGVLARRLLLCALLGAPIVPLVIEKGSEVTWINHDDIPHSIVVNALGVHSKAMDTDGTFTYKFDKTGTFFYVCGLHPFMQAKVVVK